MKVGAFHKNQEINFIVWAPLAAQVDLLILSPLEKTIPMDREGEYFVLTIPAANQNLRYKFKVNGSDSWPDPASHFQPDGVHEASEVVPHSRFNWTDKNWNGKKLKDLIIYELHIGTFTTEGTFASAEKKIDYLKKLGITAIEIMPIAQFPGERNWGYDGAYSFAVQNSYGGPEALKSFVNTAHSKGLAVILDVVYNHFGPEGNYTSKFGHYLTNNYQTPWGDSLNFDDEYSDGLRNHFLRNAQLWLSEYHIDGLRLDAIDKIKDLSAKHFLQELSEMVQELNLDGKKRFLIAESDLNDEKIIRPLNKYGYGIDAQWADDLHHSLHSLLTGETEGYYQDYGSLRHLCDAFNRSFIYNGIYSPYRKRRYGNDPSERDLEQFVVCSQNHDQIGNRAFGDRLSKLTSFEAAKVAAGTILLSPFTPLLFMGEEYFELNPFLYFTDHGDKQLSESIKKGRQEEFSSFSWKGEIPDPTHPNSFTSSKLNWDLHKQGKHKQMLHLYAELIKLRKKGNSLKTKSRKNLNAYIKDNLLIVERIDNNHLLLILNFTDEPLPTDIENKPQLIISSDEERFGGAGAYKSNGNTLTLPPFSFALYKTV